MAGDTSPTRWRRALEAFDRLRELGPAARERELAELSHAQPELHAHVLTLLEADREALARDYLSGDRGFVLPAASRPPAWQPGAEIGGYALICPLGSGGMGEVWLAQRRAGESDPPIALKVLHTHLLDSALRERFVREGRILAQLTHDNVARLLDAGVTDAGQPFLALEYVEGKPVDQWCDLRRLELAARVRMLLQICQAVAHAHTHLVVHRDLKPSNILVDADGRVRLLDFGIAKLIGGEQEAGAATELTRFGGRALTPEYAAPEQILGSNITLATDIYALGVLAYSLLSGHRPYGDAPIAVARIEHAVLETEPPPPSRARGSEEDAARLASLRATTPARLHRALRGDLDTIVMKAMKKEPGDRYGSVLALAEDLQRWLDHRPVLARPDTLVYRVRKLVRRHRVLSASVTAALASLVLGLAVSIALYQDSRAAHRRADREAAIARTVNDFLLRDLLVAADPYSNPTRNMTARELLDRAAATARQRLAREPLLHASVLATIGRSYVNIGEFDAARSALEGAIAELSEHAGARDPLTLGAQRSLIALLSVLDDPRARAVAEAVQAGAAPGSADELSARATLAMAACDDARYSECLDRLESIRASLHPRLPPDFELAFLLPLYRAEALRRLGRLPEAVDTLDQALAQATRMYGRTHPYSLIAVDHKAFVLSKMGRCSESLALLDGTRQAAMDSLGDVHVITLEIDHDRVFALSCLHLWADAEPLARSVYRRYLDHFGEGSRNTRRALHNLGVILREEHKDAEALDLLQHAWKLDARYLGADHPETLVTRNQIGIYFRGLGRLEQAEGVFREVIAQAEAGTGERAQLVFYLMHLAACLFDEGRNDEAMDTLRRAVQIAEADLYAGHPRRVAAESWLAEVTANGPTRGREIR